MRLTWGGAAVAILALAPATCRAAERHLTALAPVELWADGFRDVQGIAVDADQNVFVADREAGTVTRIAPDQARAVVARRLGRPVGLALDPAGRLLIAEEQAGRVVRLEPGGGRVTLVSGLRRPRWLAADREGRVFVSVHRFGGRPPSEVDDESVEPEAILLRQPTGETVLVADGFRELQGLTVAGGALYAATRGRRTEPRVGGAIFQIPLLAEGSWATPVHLGSSESLERPVGLALDRLGALFVTTRELEVEADHSGRAIAKLEPDGTLALFAASLGDPQGMAFDGDGNLYVADGRAGRVLRFRAPPPPVLAALPETTTEPTVMVSGTAEPGSRVALFVDDASAAIVGAVTASGAFALLAPLPPESPSTVEVFATAGGGAGLTGAPAKATIIRDGVPPTLAFLAPLDGTYVRETARVQALASDAGSGLERVTLSAAGRALSPDFTPSLPASTITATASWDTRAGADGVQTLTAGALDRAGNSASATRVVIVDNTPPETSITGGPPGETFLAEVAFSFAGTDNLTPPERLLFAWRVDGGGSNPFDASTSVTLAGLAAGPHVFEVRARDLAGNEDRTPAVRAFTIRSGPTIAAVDPAGGPAGTLVTIRGAGFEPGATDLTFNGAPPIVRSLTSTAITTTVPLGATTGPVTVTTRAGSASRPFTVTTTGDFTLAALPAPPATIRVIAGDQGTAAVQAGGHGTFASLVTLGMSPAPAGITPTLSPSTLAPGATASVAFDVASAVRPGGYVFTVTGRAEVDAQAVMRTAVVNLEVLPAGTPAVTGRVLTADAVPQPIAGVTVTLGSAFTLTDTGGNFVLLAPSPGAGMLLVDGRTASTPVAQYPPVEVNLAVNASGPTRIPFTVYLPRLDTANPVSLPLDASGATTEEVRATTPAIPGLTVTVPAGTRITGPEGNPVAQITLTPVPVDRSPMPFPPGVTAPMLFTIQPGGAVPSRPLPITFPNLTEAAPGSRADLYFFDLATGNWAVWGTGTVSADGTSVASDPGFGLPRFAWHFWDLRRPSELVRRLVTGGEPVDLQSGRFIVTKTDLVLPGRLPIAVERSYRSEDSRAGSFGIGWHLSPYDSRIVTNGATLSLVLADENAFLLAPAGPGRWTNTTEAFLLGAVVTALPGEFTFQIRFKDGTTHRYDRVVGFANVAGLAAISDRNGNTVTITREVLAPGLFGKITRITEPAGRSLTLAYDGAGRIASASDPIGRTVRYAYDLAGRLVSVTDPAGGATRYGYDGNHRILTVTVPRGITVLTNEYDAQGRVVSQTQADGGVWAFGYTVLGGLVAETTVVDPRGSRTTYRFDPAGLVLSHTDALGQTTTFEYATGSNLLVATTDPLGRARRFAYDAGGNLVSAADPAGNATTLTYEPTFNRLRSITDPIDRTIEFEYDARGNLTGASDAAGARTSLVYDSSGQPVSLITPLGDVTTLTYDARGNPVSTADPLGNTTGREHDAVGRVTGLIDARGRRTALAYDGLDRVTQVTDPAGEVTRFSYDENSNLSAVTDARGHTVRFAYDEMDRLVAEVGALGAARRFEYDPSGNPIRQTNAAGAVSTFTYDALGRRTEASYPDGRATTVSYDAGGRVVRVADSAGWAVESRHDVTDRLVAETTPVGTVEYDYDALGRRTAMRVSGQAPVTYEYDGNSRVTRVLQGGQRVALDYDVLGRRTSLALPNGVSTEYRYDAASRLTALVYRNDRGQLGDLAYEHDPAGNRTRIGGSLARTLLPDPVESASYDGANRLLEFGSSRLSYDASNDLIAIEGPTGRTDLSWDGRGRLVGVATAETAAAFAYDGLDRRVARQLNGETRHYAYDNLDIVQEVGSGGLASYLRGLGVDEVWVRNGRDHYLADGTRSIIALTDTAGDMVTRYLYEPFGAVVLEGMTSDSAFQFTGRENDGVAGLYLYRLRHYSSWLHRFVSEDPIGSLGGDNRYRYVSNNPLLFTDPLGLDVTVTLYSGAHGFGHIGVAVNGAESIGHYPRVSSRAVAMGQDVPGLVERDAARHAGEDRLERITIATTGEQDRLMLGYINQAMRQPRAYNLYSRNCATFVEEVLRAGHLQVVNTRLPVRLMRQLQEAYNDTHPADRIGR